MCYKKQCVTKSEHLKKRTVEKECEVAFENIRIEALGGSGTDGQVCRNGGKRGVFEKRQAR